MYLRGISTGDFYEAMQDYLATYLTDHMAGARFAMSLLSHMQGTYRTEPLGDFATKLLDDIEHDFAILQTIAERLETSSNPIKEAGAWLAQKASQLKLRCARDNPLGTFESLEFLSLGVLGKLKLWQVLATLAPTRPALQNIDFNELASRAQRQHDELERLRREVGQMVFAV